MKICNICSGVNDRPRSLRCLRCEKRIVNKASEERNKEKVLERQRIYRENNQEKLREIRKKTYHKYKERYRQKSLEYFIKKKGLPSDYKRWKKKAGEGNVSSSGYKIITISDKSHPNCQDTKGRIAEHVYVMSQHINRPLKKGETVHHINGDRLDNHIENLELWYRSHPPGQRLDDKIKWAIEFLTEYGYKIEKE